MKNEHYQRIRYTLLACLCCWATSAAHAQFFPPGGGGTTAGRTGSSSVRQYPNNTAVGDAQFTIDPDTRKVFIVTDENTYKNMRNVLQSRDRAKPQVLIKVVFLEVTYNNSLDIGVEGTFGRGFGNSWISGLQTNFSVVGTNIVPTSIVPSRSSSTFGVSNLFGLGASGANPTPPGAGVYSILGQDFQATLRAIAQAGKTEVLSRPSILARNSQPATISLGQQVPLITATRFDTLGNQINTVSYQNVGIILQVTPFITSDGSVEMIVQPQTSELEQDRTKWVPISSGAGGSISAPVINQRSADTVVVVPDGQTVIIGGLMERSKAQSDSKIPILGDIPLLGALFKHRQKADVKTELMIFLTPHIVSAPTDLAGLTARERARSSIDPKSFSEQELNQFLEGLPPAPDKDKTVVPSGSKSRKK